MSKSSRAAFGTYSTKPIKKAVQAPVITQAVSAPAPLAPLEAKEELKSEPKPVVIESKAVEQVLEELKNSKPPTAVPGWNQAYHTILNELAPSVVRQLEDRLSRKHYDFLNDDHQEIHEILERSLVSYNKKRERGKLASAARRAQAKAEKTAPPDEGDAADEE